MSIVVWVVSILVAWVLLGAVIAFLLGAAIARNERASRAARAAEVPDPEPEVTTERVIPSPRTVDTPRPRRRILDPTRPPRGRREGR